MTFQVRLYIHHDNDLIQLYLNGIRLSDVFAKSLEAHYKKEDIRFDIPEKLEFKPHKGKVYRVKVTLDEKKHPDLVRWVCAFPDQYKCHCIKNIARTYLGSSVIDSLNGMSQAGTWVPDNDKEKRKGRTVRLKEWKKKDSGQGNMQWIDQVSATREKTEEQWRKAEEGRKKIRSTPIEEILGARPADIMEGPEPSPYHTAAGTAMAAEEQQAAEPAAARTGLSGDGTDNGNSRGNEIHGSNTFHEDPMDAGPDTAGGGNAWMPDGMEAQEDPEDFDDFDASLLFEQLRTQ